MKIRNLTLALVVIAGALLLNVQSIYAQEEKMDDVYEPGTVWNVTYVRTDANMEDQYLLGLSKTWAAAMEKFVDAGLIVSYKILSGEASNDDDFNLMLMIEFKNFAMYDPDPERQAKFEEIEKQVQEELGDEYKETLKNYPNIRDILGSKTLREMKLK
jgi:hypothetical protein